MAIDPHDHHAEHSHVLMPAWFSYRMMHDLWSFGLLMSNGTWIGIKKIESITLDANGNLWLDVMLMTKEEAEDLETIYGVKPLIYAPTDRREASIAAAHVMMATEMADT